MKIRVKLAKAASCGVVRLDVDGSTPFEEVSVKVLQLVPDLGDIDPATLQISLNKKTPLVLEPGATVSSTGLCNGDTLWVLNALGNTLPASIEANTSTTRPASSSVQEVASFSSTTIVSESKRPKTAVKMASSTGPLNSCAAAKDTTTEPDSTTGEQVIDIRAATDPHLPPEEMEDAIPDADPDPNQDPDPRDFAPLGCGVPDALSRVISAALATQAQQRSAPTAGAVDVSGTTSTSHADGGGIGVNAGAAQVMAAASGKLLAGSSHLLLVAAAHAALQETGFIPIGDEGAASVAGVHGLPPGVVAALTGTRPGAGPVKLDYRHPAMGDAGQATSSGTVAPTTCSVRGVVMTHHLVLHAAVSGGPGGGGTVSTRITLDAQQWVNDVQRSGLQGTPTINPAGPSTGPTGATRDQGGPTPSSIAAEVVSRYRDLAALWRLLKDDLALWLLTWGCRRAGVAAPVGLLLLPCEIKESILSQLEVQDLLTASRACSELRHLSTAEFIWQGLYEREFKSPGTADQSQVDRQGWRAAFIAKWRERCRRRRDMARRQRLMMPTCPYPMFPNSILPRPAHPFNPPMVGGDYDRLPQPLMGPGPGFLPGAFGRGPLGPGGGGAGWGPFPGGLPGGRRGDFRLV